MAHNDGYRIVYLDETMFTRKTVADTEWARSGENIRIDEARLREPTLALIAAISAEKGREHFKIYPKSVNTARFVEWLSELRNLTQGDKICLFLDNLSSHTCDESKKTMRDLGFRWCFNVAYSPEWNPIELIFSKVKHNFKVLRA